MIWTIRVLGAALGAFVGLGLAAIGTGLFTGVDYAGFILAAWTIAWLIVGFAVLPYLTVVPATWIISRVQELSTAEFVASVLGLLVGLLLGLLLRHAAVQRGGPARDLAAARRLAVPGPGDDGPDGGQAVRPDRSREGAGLVRRPTPEGDRRAGETKIVVDTSVAHRRPDRRDRRVGLPLRDARSSRASCSRSCSTSRTRRHASPQPRPPRPGDPDADAARPADADPIRTTRRRRIAGGRRQAGGAGEATQPGRLPTTSTSTGSPSCRACGS